MRLRRLEFVVIGLTLAFAFFIGGFFAGRNWSAVNIVPVSAHNDEFNHTVGNGAQSSDSVLQTESDSPANDSKETTIAVPPVDIEQIPQVPKSGVSPEAGAPRAGDGRININLASQSELTDLPGIGNVLASRIIDYRRQHGDFARIEDLRNVSGIGEKRYEAIQDKVTVG